MNKYSLFQQILHRFALSSKFIREAAFDIESSLISSSNPDDNHIFITGLARSGTTILLNAIYEANIFASLTYGDMPFTLSPNLWSKILPNQKKVDSIERFHKDGIRISIKSPEAFEEVFWKTFNEADPDSKEKFKTYVQLIAHKYKKKRYLSKNNQNIKRISLILDIFPNSKILVPFRDPVQHANSLLNQHKKFIKHSKKDRFFSNYIAWIGHTEFGQEYIPIHSKNLSYKNDLDINHWLEQWYLTYKQCHDTFKSSTNVHFISYEKLCNSEKYWLQILKILNIDRNNKFHFQQSNKNVIANVDNDLVEKTSFIFSLLNQK